MKTHYQLLGIGRDASAAQIRDAYQQELEAVSSAQQFATNNELKIRRMVLQQAYQTLSSPLRRQQYDAGLAGRHNAGKLIAHRSPATTAVLSMLSAGILMLGAYIYLRQQHKADPVPDTLQSMAQGGPASKAVRAARPDSRHKEKMRRKMLAEKLHAQQMQREAMPEPTAQSADEAQPSGSGINSDANPARQSMRRWPE